MTFAIAACSEGSESTIGAGGAAAADGGGSGGTATGGSGNSSGSGGSAAGSGGTTGTPTSCGTRPFLADDVIAKASVALLTCLSDDGFYRTQVMLRGAQGGYSYPGGTAFIECLASVTNGCAGVRSCLGLLPQQGNETCDSCQDNVAVVCGDLNALWDCSAIDATCQGGRCVPTGSEACASAAFSDYCDDAGRPVHCDDFLQIGPRCSDFGLSCSETESPSRCVGTGTACPADSFPYFDVNYVGQSCQNAQLTACVRGATAELDCSCFGRAFDCQAFAGATFCGRASECDPATHVNTCDGNDTVFCDAGKLTHVDCAALGFTTCGSDPRVPCM